MGRPAIFAKDEEDASRIHFAEFQNPWTFLWLVSQGDEVVLKWCLDHGLLANIVWRSFRVILLLDLLI